MVPAKTEPMWGIGRIRLPDLTLSYPLSRRDVDQDTLWAMSVLTHAKLTSGKQILFIGTGSEWGQAWPYQNAAMRIGAVASYAEDTPFDAPRIEMFTRRFDFHAILGVNATVLDGLEKEGHDLATVFKGVESVFAFPDAHRRLRDAGIDPWLQFHLGGAYAFVPPGESELIYDTNEWLLEAPQGKLVLTAIASRAAPVVRLPTGLKGAVRGEGPDRKISVSIE